MEESGNFILSQGKFTFWRFRSDSIYCPRMVIQHRALIWERMGKNSLRSWKSQGILLWVREFYFESGKIHILKIPLWFNLVPKGGYSTQGSYLGEGGKNSLRLWKSQGILFWVRENSHFEDSAVIQFSARGWLFKIGLLFRRVLISFLGNNLMFKESPWPHGSTLISESSSLGSSSGRGHCVVFLGKTPDSHSASLHPRV